MTYGTPNWGASEEASAAMFNRYVDAGGNFVDTADVYAGGRAEELVGSYIASRNLRDQIVLATKFTFHSGAPGNVHGGGNGRKHMFRALDYSLERLRTAYIDLYWMHAWDLVTPVEEVLESFAILVRSGKIRYFGFSDVPAWYAAKAATLASAHAMPAPIALQHEYSLVERSIEREHVPAARELGLGICSWAPLAGGLLAGKYQRDGNDVTGQGRLDTHSGSNNRFQAITDQHWQTVEVLQTIAKEIGRPMAQVALAWASSQTGITSLILGASKPDQLGENLASLDIRMTAEQLHRLDEISALDAIHPYLMFNADVQRSMLGGNAVNAWR